MKLGKRIAFPRLHRHTKYQILSGSGQVFPSPVAFFSLIPLWPAFWTGNTQGIEMVENRIGWTEGTTNLNWNICRLNTFYKLVITSLTVLLAAFHKTLTRVHAHTHCAIHTCRHAHVEDRRPSNVVFELRIYNSVDHFTGVRLTYEAQVSLCRFVSRITKHTNAKW